MSARLWKFSRLTVIHYKLKSGTAFPSLSACRKTKGTPSLTGLTTCRPFCHFVTSPHTVGSHLFQNSPLDCFEIHSLRSARRLYAGLCPTPHQRRCLWTLPKGHCPFGIPLLVKNYFFDRLNRADDLYISSVFIYLDFTFVFQDREFLQGSDDISES